MHNSTTVGMIREEVAPLVFIDIGIIIILFIPFEILSSFPFYHKTLRINRSLKKTDISFEYESNFTLWSKIFDSFDKKGFKTYSEPQ